MIAPTKFCLSIALLLPASLATAQDTPAVDGSPATDTQAAAAAEPEMTGQDFLSLRTNGLDASLVSPKDLAYLGAIKMLIARLSELPEELGEQNQIPPAAIPLVERLVYGQLDLRVGSYDEGVPVPLPIYFRLEIDKQEGHAPFAELLTNLLMQVGMPLEAPDADGHVALPIPIPVKAWFADVDGDFVLEFGTIPAESAQTSQLKLPNNGKLAGKFNLDFGKLASTVRSFMTTDAEREQFDEVMKATQLGDLALEMLIGNDGRSSFQKTAMRDWGSSPTAALYRDNTVSVAALNLIPVDVEWAMIAATNFSAMLSYVEGMAKENLGPDAELAGIIGPMIGLPEFDIQRDFLGHLGTTQGAFSSRASGGGFYSAVAFIDLANADAFASTLDQLEDHVLGLIKEDTKGYFKLNRYDHNGVAMTSFQFPGLPMPLQPAYGIGNGQLVMGLSVQAVEAAFAHMATGGSNLTEAPGFLDQLGGDIAKAQSIYYFDVPGLISDGYGLMDLWTNMLSNAVTSREGAAGEPRAPGRLLPSLRELQKGALPIVSMYWVDGNDLKSETRMDPSGLVNAAAIVPYVAKIYVPLFAIFGGVFAAAPKDGTNDFEEAIEQLLK